MGSLLLDHIEMFNRKERYFLLAHALAQPRDPDGVPRMRLSGPFAHRLSKALDGFEVQPGARCWMDFHMDWLYASLVTTMGMEPAPYKTPFLDENKEPFRLNRNQEDIDLLVGFDSPDGPVLLLVEAKGYGAWDMRQLRSKARRLECIFGAGGQPMFDGTPVVARFVLASPSPPPDLPPGSAWEGGFPAWMSKSSAGEPNWLPMKLPSVRVRPVAVPEKGQKPSESLSWELKTLSTDVDRQAE